MFKKTKLRLFILSVLLPFLLMGSSIGALSVINPDENISSDTSKEIVYIRDKIGEKDGVITINGKKVHYVPDSQILFDPTSETKEAKFVKPEEVSTDEIVCNLFPEGSPCPTDAVQGDLDICWLISAFSQLAENNPEFIKENLIEYKNDFVIVKFFDYDDGSPFYVMVQKTIPNMDNRHTFIRNNCLWVHMYLKACVAMRLVNSKSDSKQAVSYEDLISPVCIIPRFLRIITGKLTDFERVYMEEEKDVYEKIKKILDSSGIVLCDFDDPIVYKLPILKYFLKNIEKQGLVIEHCYSVTKVYEDKNGIRWIKCRNPWGRHVPVYDKNGNLYPNKCTNTGGYFCLKMKDFIKKVWIIYFSTEKNIKDK